MAKVICILFTCSCYRGVSLWKTVRARDIFVKVLGKVREEMGFRLLGYVVMPEHVHLLMSEPREGTPSTALHKLKLRVARKLRKRERAVSEGQLRLLFAETGEPRRAFWQARFYDFNVYSTGKQTEKLNYMHANPVIADWWNIRRIGGGVVGDFTGQERWGAWLWTWETETRRTPKTQVHKPNLGHPPRWFQL